jgi:hypothetical protein
MEVSIHCAKIGAAFLAIKGQKSPDFRGFYHRSVWSCRILPMLIGYSALHFWVMGLYDRQPVRIFHPFFFGNIYPLPYAQFHISNHLR